MWWNTKPLSYGVIWMPQLSFCPTGGITTATAPDYLALANVTCVGGSWIAPEADQRARDWDAIGGRARAAASLQGQVSP